MKSRILTALGRADGFVSGQELCDGLKVSRTAVWKVINQLKDEGYEIESVTGKGYRITARPDVVTSDEVESRLRTQWAGHPVHFFETIDSTNNAARKLAEDGAPGGTLAVAEEQRSGKGRRGRGWVMEPGSAIAMSLIVRPQIQPSRASMMTLVMGMAVTAACRSYCGVQAGIKWPNDVVVDGKKICGILTEMSSEIDFINYLVIGAGINTHVEHFPEELSDRALSLHTVMGRKPDRAGLIAACMEKFEQYYGLFLKTQDMSLLREEYESFLVGTGDRVRVLEPGNEYEGVSCGIDDRGELLVRRADGTVEHVYAGEVSVRGIYGYV